MARRAVTVISDSLVIKALNTPGGSGGVARDMNRTIGRVLASAKARAPVGNPLDRTHDKMPVGRYKKSLKRYRWGSRHVLLRVVYSDAPHAQVVERGRPSTSFAELVWAFGQEHFIGGYKRHGSKRNVILPETRYTYWREEGIIGPKAWEKFGWSKAKVPGAVYWYAGSRGYEGFHVLEKALRVAQRRYASAAIRPGSGPFFPKAIPIPAPFR